MFHKGNAVNWTFVQIAVLFYLALPFFLFLLFWYHSPWNLVFIIIGGISLYRSFAGIKENPEPPEFGYDLKEVAWLGVWAMLLAFVVGAGGWMPQDGDYEKTNGIFDGLKALHWPWGCQFSDGKILMFVYYFGYHLIPAMFGYFGGRVAIDIVSFVSASFGLWLGLVAVGKYFRIPSWTLVLFMGFSGLAFVGLCLHSQRIPFPASYPLWSSPLIDPSMLQIFCSAPPHFDVPLVLLPLFLRALDKKRFDQAFAWIALGLFWSPLAMIGIALFALVDIPKASWRDILNFRNMGLIVAIVFPLAVFFSMRLFPEKWIFLGNNEEVLKNYPIFICLDFAMWLIFIRQRFWKDPRLWLALVFILILPFFTMGHALDLFFRTGLPLKIFLFAVVIKSVVESPTIARVVPFGIVYLLGGIVPFSTFYMQTQNNTVHPLSSRCRHDGRSFLIRMDSVFKQYVGNKNANLLTKELIKDVQSPERINGSLEDNEIYRVVYNSKVDAETAYDREERPFYKVYSRLFVYWINHKDPQDVQIAFQIENETKQDMSIVIIKKETKEDDFYTPFERLEARSNAGYHLEPDSMEKITVPRNGCNVVLTTRLNKCATIIALLKQPPEKVDIINPCQKSIYLVKNLNLRILEEKPPRAMEPGKLLIQTIPLE
jgi:hypothetical protein